MMILHWKHGLKGERERERERMGEWVCFFHSCVDVLYELNGGSVRKVKSEKARCGKTKKKGIVCLHQASWFQHSYFSQLLAKQHTGLDNVTSRSAPFVPWLALCPQRPFLPFLPLPPHLLRGIPGPACRPSSPARPSSPSLPSRP